MAEPDLPGVELLDGLDPYELMQVESGRIEALLRGLDDEGWAAPTGCAGWSRRDLLGHLAATEEYFHAGIDHAVGEFLTRYLELGATDLHSFNELGVVARAEVSTEELLDRWVGDAAATADGMRQQDGGTVDTSVGEYPCRLQAFHVATELATHADDLGVVVPAAEVADRLDWRTRFSAVALVESKPTLEVEVADGVVMVRGPEFEATVSAEDFVAAVAGRLPEHSSVSAETAAALSTMP